MSIWATDVDFDADDHGDNCKVWVKVSWDAEPGEWHAIADGQKFRRDLSRGCTCRCGPIKYQGSHVLPADDNERAGSFWTDHIPGFITRPGRDDGPDDEYDELWWPYLRVGVAEADEGEQTVVLDRAQVVELHEYLGSWLARTGPERH